MAVGTTTALLIAAGTAAAGTAMAARDAQKANNRAIAEEQRRRAPFEATAYDLSKYFSNLDFSGPSPISNALQSRLREVMDTGFGVDNLTDMPTQIINQMLEGTQGAFDADRAQLADDIQSRFAGQFGVRAGGDLPHAIAKGTSRQLADRNASAYGMLPNLMGQVITGNAAYNDFLTRAYQLDLQERQRPLELASTFAAQQPLPPSAFWQGTPSALSSGLISAGSIMSQFPSLMRTFGSGNNGAGLPVAGQSYLGLPTNGATIPSIGGDLFYDNLIYGTGGR